MKRTQGGDHGKGRGTITEIDAVDKIGQETLAGFIGSGNRVFNERLDEDSIAGKFILLGVED